MSANNPDETVSRAEVFTRVLEAGKFVWIVFGVLSDRSGTKIFGVYHDQSQAEERVKIAREAGAIYSMNYAKVPLDRAFSVDLNP